MEPEIRYGTTEDGVRIAYAVTGNGPPIVCATEPMTSHVQLEWAQPVSNWYRGLACGNILIRFDPVGVVFEDRGEFAPNGIGDAVRLYAVRVQKDRE